MNVLDEIRRTSGDEMRDAASVRWAVLERHAKGRTKNGDAAALRAARSTLGKTEADDEKDAALLAKLAEYGDIAERHRVGDAERERLRASAKQKTAHAVALVAEAAALDDESARELAQARSIASRQDTDRNELDSVLRELAQRGNEEIAASLHRIAAEAQLPNAQRELTEAEVHLAGIEANGKGRSPNENAHLQRPLAAAQRRVAELKTKVRELVGEIGGAP